MTDKIKFTYESKKYDLANMTTQERLTEAAHLVEQVRILGQIRDGESTEYVLALEEGESEDDIEEICSSIYYDQIKEDIEVLIRGLNKWFSFDSVFEEYGRAAYNPAPIGWRGSMC